MTVTEKKFIHLFVTLVFGMSAFLAWPSQVYAQEWEDLSADFDGDGLLNVIEQDGWYNAAGGPFYTDPLDADSDDDGLSDGREKLYDTHPFNDHSPGIYVEYEKYLQTKEYYPWQRFGDKYIALPYPQAPWGEDTVVVRRGATFSVGGPADGALTISKSIGALTTLTPVRNPCSGRWDIHVPEDGTVGIYTITVEDGSWDEHLNLYIIFQLPTNLSDAFVDAFIYDDDPENKRDDTSIHYGENPEQREYDHDDYEWIPEGEWIYHGYAWDFDNKQYEDYVFEDHVIQAINGADNTWDAANTLGQRVDEYTCVQWPQYQGNSWCALNPHSCSGNYRNECTSVAALLSAFHRSAGISSRPVWTDWRHSSWDHSTEVWTKPAGGTEDWYVMRGYASYEGPCSSPQTSEGYVQLRSTLGWYSGGYGLYTVGENWPESEVNHWASVNEDEYRMATWQFDKPNQVGKIVKKDWWETRFVDYWGWPAEPTVTGAPPDDWPDLSGPTEMAALSNAALSADSHFIYIPIVLNNSVPGSEIKLGRVVADYGIDQDGDGRFDQLAFQIQVNVAQAGNYWFRGRLAGGFSEAIGKIYLEAGRHTIELPFDGMDIYLNKAHGPYLLDGLWVTDVENPGKEDFVNGLDFRQPDYQTSPYKFDDFGVLGATLTNEYSYETIDTDDDGYADALIVETNLRVKKLGIYTVQGVLYAGQDETPVQASWTGYGPHVTLQFYGLKDTTGPYTLAHLFVRDAADQVTDGIKEPYALGEISELSARSIHLGVQPTMPADPSEMRLTFIITDTGYSDAGVDTDGDGKFDQLVITTTVEVEPGEGGQAYRLEGWLADANGSLISWGTGDPQVLAEGAQSLSLAFDGRLINEHGVDGPFTLTALKALSGTYTVLDEVDVAYTTSAYDYDAFEEAAVAPAASLFDDDVESWTVEGDSFETGALGAAWVTSSSTSEGRIQVTGDYGTARGAYALLMDDTSAGTYTLNEAVWTVDLSGVSEASLTFWHAEWGDEQHDFNGDFTGSYNADGVAISADGVNWHPIQDAPDQEDGVWKRYTIDLAAEAAAAGMTLGPNFRIKFQQYDNYPLITGSDGRGWDEIVIVAEGTPGGQWMSESPWSLEENVWYSYSHAWEADTSVSQSGLLTATAVDASEYANTTLEFATCYQIPSGSNAGYVQVSPDGLDWTNVLTFTGSTTHWTTELVDLSDFGETSNLQFRFNADSQTGLLWYVDDVYLNAWPAVTSASFDYLPATVLRGETITFEASYTSITDTLPITYTWDFDDGSPIEVTTAPTVTHQFTSLLGYTVQLTVENPYDIAVVSDTITATNAAPIDISLSNDTIAEGEPIGAIVGLFSATDPNSSDTHTYTLVSGVGDMDNGSFAIVGNQLETAEVFDYEAQNSYSIRVQADDGHGGVYEEQFTITITDINEAPTFTSTPVTTATEDAAYSYNIAAEDVDAGDALTVTPPTLPGWLALNDAGDGTATLTGTPDDDDVGDWAVTLQVRDTAGLTDTQTFTITVTNVNDAPVFTSTPVTTATEDAAYSYNIAAEDVDAGDTLTITAPALPGWLDLTDNGGGTATLEGTPTNAQVGNHGVSLLVRDTGGLTGTQTFTITVSNVNDAPEANGDAYSLNEADTLAESAPGVLGNDTDADGDTLTATLVSDVSYGTLALNGDGSFTYEHDGSENHGDGFTYKANDGQADSNTVTVSFTITPVNDTPVVAGIPDHTIDEGETFAAINLDDYVADADNVDTEMTWSFAGNVALQVSIVERVATVGVPDADWNGSEIIVFTATDPGGLSASDTATFTVNAVNDAPTDITLDDDSVAENEPISTTVGAFSTADQDSGDTHTYALVSGPGDADNGSFAIVSDTLQTAESFDYETQNTYTIRVQTDDGNGGTYEAAFTITVTDVNDAPVAMDDAYSVDEGDTLVVTAPGVLANDTDADGDPLTTSLVSGVSYGILTLNGDGSFTYTHDGSENHSDSFTYQANDTTANSNVTTVSITVATGNDAPVAVDDTYSVDEGDTLTIAAPGVLANDTDADGDPLTASLVSGVSYGTLTLNGDGSFTYTHDGSENHSDSFTYQANDTTANSNVATVSITVNPVNDAPVATDDAYSVDEGGILTVVAPGVLVNDTDADGDSLTTALVSGVSYGVLTLNGDGSFIYTHDGSENHSDSFTYQVSDGSADSNVATVNITVNAGNDAPVAMDDAYSVDESETLTITAPGVLANDTDADGDSLTASLASDVSHGTLTLNGDGSFTYTHDGSETTGDSFTYRANDTVASSNVATVNITISAGNDMPVAVDDAYSVDEGGILTVAAPGVLVNDTDADGDSLTASLVSDVAHGALTLNGDGSFTYTHDGSETISDSFTYQANDTAADSNVATVSITINEVNDAPVANNDSYSMVESSALNVNAPGVLDNDTDAESDTLSAILINDVAHGTLMLNVNGSFTYTHDSSETTSDSFTYRANDTITNSNVATVSITINPVNDAPVANDDAYSVDEGGTLDVNAPGVLDNDSDAEDDTLSAVLVDDGVHGTLTFNADGSFSYTHDGTENHSDSFTYKANDGIADSDVIIVSITVNPVNDAPVANSDSYSVDQGDTLNVNAPGVLGNDNDADQDTLTVVLIGDVTHGTLTLNADGSFGYTHDGSETTSDSFTYEANDGIAGSHVATVSIIVNMVNDPPKFTSAPVLTATEGVTYTYNIVASDVDTGDTLGITASTLPSWLNLIDNGDGTARLSGKPASAEVGNHDVELRVEDAEGAFDTQPFIIQVAASAPERYFIYLPVALRNN